MILIMYFRVVSKRFLKAVILRYFIPSHMLL